MHGVILAGGAGTRLRPLTTIINKQLLPINKRPIIDYPISTLIKMGCTEITVILGSDHFSQIVSYLKDGSERGVKINFLYQDKAMGIAHAVNLCQSILKHQEHFIVLLGDNLYFGPINLESSSKAQIVLYDTPEIKRFGCAYVQQDKIVEIVEKPQTLRTDCEHYAITGLYVFTYRFFEYFTQIKPSLRNEFEITEIIDKYRQHDILDYTIFQNRWLDCGTFETIKLARQWVDETGLEETLV